MTHNEALETVIRSLTERQLGKALAQLSNYLYTFNHTQATEQLEQLRTDFLLMTDYWQKGFEDPQRSQLYDQLLKRTYSLAMNVLIRYYIRNSSFANSAYTRARANREDWTPASLRRDMESFVADVAMLELEPEYVRKQKQHDIYQRHEQMMADLFDYIWTSRLWSGSVTEAFEQMLLSPTIDVRDQQLLVSAVMLSTILFFDINKFQLLINVYRQSTDEHVRQTALVGWVLSLDDMAAKLYEEVHDLVSQVTADERCRNELTELQMQMIYCLNADSDSRKIHEDIMSDILKNNGQFRITRNGLEEVEEDSMEDVLNPELSEQRMEKLEQSMRKMSDMQNQGSDIYFGGFAQMKRFPFFDRVGNWFLPYYPQHTAVVDILSSIRGRNFIHRLLSNGPFCDSDKYSFVIAFKSVVSHISPSVLELMDNGEAMLIGADLDNSDFNTPAYFRRSCLQNIYRFFKLFPARGDFRNLLEDDGASRFHFFGNPLLHGMPLEQKFIGVAAFMMKHGAYEAARATLSSCSEATRNEQFYLLCGTLLMRTQGQCAGLTARQCFEHYLNADSEGSQGRPQAENDRAMARYARILFNDRNYEGALSYYRHLALRHEQHQGYQLNEAVCLTNLKRYDEALKILYRLNYAEPDNQNVNRVLAWTLTGSHKYEQALKLFDTLLSVEQPEPDDLLNAAYCHWFFALQSVPGSERSQHISDAVTLFRRYAGQASVTFDPVKEFLDHEKELLADHGIPPVEVQLMIDQL